MKPPTPNLRRFESADIDPSKAVSLRADHQKAAHLPARKRVAA